MSEVTDQGNLPEESKDTQELSEEHDLEALNNKGEPNPTLEQPPNLEEPTSKDTKENLVENENPEKIEPSTESTKQETEIVPTKGEAGDGEPQVEVEPIRSTASISINTKQSIIIKETGQEEQVKDNVTDAASEIFAQLLEDEVPEDHEGYEDTIEEYETMGRSSGDIQTDKKSVMVKRRKLVSKDTVPAKERKKEVTYNEVVQSKEVEVEDEEEYVWVEEEVDEEVEVETDEETVEEEEDIEEEFEEQWEGEYEEGDDVAFEELEKGITGDIEEIEDEEIMEVFDEEEQEETELYKDEIEEELGELEEVIEDLGEEEVGEVEEIDILETEIEEIGEEKAEEEYEQAEEALEYETEEEAEEEERPRKHKRRLKTIKIFRMVRKRKKDVIAKLQKQSEVVDETQEKSQLQLEDENEKAKAEAAKKEWDEQVELIKALANELIIMKRKNRNLSRTIIDYYKRRSENVQEIEPPTHEILLRYHKRLNVLKEYKKATNSEMARIADEVNALKEELSTLTNEYNKEKTELLSWEAELGKGLITHTGSPLEESVVSHLVQRHEVLLNKLSNEQLQLVTLQNQIAVKEAALKNLVVFEGNLSLMDYEQLRMDNQVFSEKLEERDNELAHLRKKVLEIIHTHAHVLEKSDAVADSIENCGAKDHKMNFEVNELREKVNKLKRTRDRIREKTRKLRKGAGLLIRPKLAVDYAESVNKIENKRQKLESLINTFNKHKVKIETFRKRILEASVSDDIISQMF